MRWERATGERPRRDGVANVADVWPASVPVAATDVDVAIARTEPAYGGNAGVAEIRALHEDMIAAARRDIFAENQYFTSRAIATAFARRLDADDAPDALPSGAVPQRR